MALGLAGNQTLKIAGKSEGPMSDSFRMVFDRVAYKLALYIRNAGELPIGYSEYFICWCVASVHHLYGLNKRVALRN